ncbi:tumor necrosis factor ligand superfamily member 10-like [Branchiostoma floridae]|uniref:Tumor necrosis factor ligand superfamily member 10-like n=1 Tax=Branchiostoma floridae TaxID=7739 RepID=A0A9J7LFN1_BRAFL|nr:tumor necrosis factor ligand superfamily member 10-like [Branchiostoma floridae]
MGCKGVYGEKRCGHFLELVVFFQLALLLALCVSFVTVTVNLNAEIEELRTVVKERNSEKQPGDESWISSPLLAAVVQNAIAQALGNITTDKERDRKQTGRFTPYGPLYTLDNDGEGDGKLGGKRGGKAQGYLAKPMAHLTGSIMSDPEMDLDRVLRPKNSMVRVKGWEWDQGLATLANGMKYGGGYIQVPMDGLYYVYSQLYFRYMKDDDKTRKHVQMLHYTFKRSDTYRVAQELMKSARTKCWSKHTDYELLSSYQGGVFRLRQGDKLYVAVSNVDFVSFEETASYFGAFLI